MDPLATWHLRAAPGPASSENFEGVAYGNDRWVIVGGDGTILSSPDGVTWSSETNPIGDKGLDDVAFGGGLFVAVGRGPNVMLTSPDGRQWTQQTPGISGAAEVIHDGTRFVMVVAGGFVFTSTNGVDWPQLQRAPVNYDLGGLAFGNGIYVEAGYKRTGKPPDLFSTPDLVDWSKRDAVVSQNLMNVGYGLGLFVAIGQGGALITSPDGATWTPRPHAHTGFIWDVACDGKHLVAAAQWGRLLSSPDGIAWTVQETELPWHLTDIAFGKGTFVAVGWDQQIVQSDPVPISPPEGGIKVSDLIKAGNQCSFQFTAEVGQSYQVFRSGDLKAWAPLATLTATSSPMNFTDAGAGEAPRFYRVVKP